MWSGRNFFVALLAIVTAFAISGCTTTSKYMQIDEQVAGISELLPQQSALVFFRDEPMSFGAGIQAPIVEAINGDVAFISIISEETKMIHKTAPGKHIYIVGGEGSNMLEANLEPQKYYYVRVEPKMGVWKARFIFVPVTDSGAGAIAQDLSGCQWVVPGASAQGWFADNKESMREKALDAIKTDREGELRGKAIIGGKEGLPNLIR